MALAKFAFRSLVRLYPDPGELLAQANEVALGELAGGNFVTMLCVTVHPADRRGVAWRARAIHRARVLAPTGTSSASRSRGLALGSRRASATRTSRHSGARRRSLPLHGRARRGAPDADLYGEERLDAALATRRDLSAQALAEHLVADARAFAGEPEDDYAVVVIRRTGG